MKHFFKIVFFIASLSFQLHAQDTNFCGTTEKETALHTSHPEILIDEQKLDQFIKDWVASNSIDLRDDKTYVIPIVFHIIHDYGFENISDDQVKDAVRILNEDYQMRNADTSAIVSSFKSVKGNAHFEFRLANKTISGECTTGIEHIHSLQTYIGDDGSKLSDWSRSMYLNVWTVKDMADGVAGYAYYPGSVSAVYLAPIDGVIILSNYIGSIGTSSALTSRALTHEIGHTMNLAHTWGNTNAPGVACGDDGINDTPETKGWTSCNLTGSKCNPPIIENVQNYMEYAYCSKMFTQGQAAVMQGTLNSPASDRVNLWTDGNLVSTGTDDTIETLCAPQPDFYSTYTMACTNKAIPFHDVSSGGNEESRVWTFQDGNPATSPDKNPSVSFSSPGWKSVTLTASNTAGSKTLTLQKAVFISDESAAQYSLGYWESFEDPNSFSNDWLQQNPEGNSSVWNRTSNAGYNSSSSLMLNNFRNMKGDKDNLITPSFNLSVAGNVYLNFRYSCGSTATSSGNINDVLKIYSSLDCGTTWALRTTISGIALANAGYFPDDYVPNSGSPWVGKSLLLPTFLLTSNVRFKFEFSTNGMGNNMYIDDVNIGSNPVSVNDPDAAPFTVNVFPNPLTENSTVILHVQKPGVINLRIVDLTGRTINLLNNEWLGEGTHHFDLNAVKLREGGVYLLIADDGVSTYRTKIVVQ